MKTTLALATLCLVSNFPGFADEVSAARGVFERTLGKEAAQTIELKLEPGAADRFRYSAAGGKIAVTGTSTAALCRGVYDYLRANQTPSRPILEPRNGGPVAANPKRKYLSNTPIYNP